MSHSEHRVESLIEALLESATAVVAIFAHSVLVETFHLGKYGWFSFLIALVAAFGVWTVFRWRTDVWLKSRGKESKIEGTWRAVIRKGDEPVPYGVSILNILRDHEKMIVQGRSIELRGNDRTELYHGSWKSEAIAFSESDLTLMYTFFSHTHRTYGSCTYTFERSGIRGKSPVAYSGRFFDDNVPTKEFRVSGTRNETQIDLTDEGYLKQWAREVWRDRILNL
jgi:hypothetical protein